MATICSTPQMAKHSEEMNKLFDRWNNNDAITKLYGIAGTDNTIFHDFANQMLLTKSLGQYSLESIPMKDDKIDMSAYRYIKEGIDDMAKVIQKGISPLAANMLMAHETLDKHPATAKYDQRVSDIVNYERRNKTETTDAVKDIEKSLMAATVSLGGKGKYHNAVKALDELQMVINEKLSKGEDVSAEYEAIEALTKSDSTKGVINAFVRIMDNFDKNDINKTLTEISRNNLTEITIDGHKVGADVFRAVIPSVNKARVYLDNMGKVNINGLRSMKELANQYYSNSELARSGNNKKMIDNINKGIDEAIQRIEISMKEGKYFPHYSIESIINANDVLKDIDNSHIYDPTGNQTVVMMRAIENAVHNLSSNQKGRSVDDMKVFVMNPTKVLESYGEVATQFNKNTSLMSAYMKMLKDIRGNIHTLTDMRGIDSIIDFTTEKLRATMYGAADTDNVIKKTLSELTKISALSKMGLSVTGALRNATQISFYTLATGFRNYKRGNDLLKSETRYQIGDKSMNIREIIQSQEKEGGYFFSDIENVAHGSLFNFSGVDKNSFVVKEDINGNFYLEYKRKGKLEILDEASAKASNASLFLHQMGENYVRKKVYSNAFALHFEKAYTGGEYERMISGYYSRTQFENGKPKWIEGISPDAAINKLKRNANNVALNMVRMTQFEYGKNQKPVMMGGGTGLKSSMGSVLFQFMTYPSGLFSYNKKIFTEAYRSMKDGDFDNWSVGAAGRLIGMQAVIGMMSILFANDFGNMINNDTYDRIDKLYTLLTADPDDKKTANYGQGVLSLFTGPVVSDGLFLLNAAGLDWSDNEYAQLALGYNNYADMTDDKKVRRSMQVASTAVAKLMKDADNIVNGNASAIASNYLGMYTTKELREKHDVWMNRLGLETSKQEQKRKSLRRKELKMLEALKNAPKEDKDKYVSAIRSIKNSISKIDKERQSNTKETFTFR